MDPLVFRVPKRTYLDWLRGANVATLERAERVRLRDDAEWRRDRSEDAAALDALVGKVVRLRRGRKTHGGKERVRGEPFLVVDVWLGRLHGIEPALSQGKLSVPILLRPEWVSLDVTAEFVVLGRGGSCGPEEAGRVGRGVEGGEAGAAQAPG